MYYVVVREIIQLSILMGDIRK